MKIEIWADIICPWCGLGSHRLGQAVKRFGHEGEVEVIHRSFQLDTEFPENVSEPVREFLRERKGMSEAQIVQGVPQIERMAHEEGIEEYHVLENRVGNTSLAHELLAYASQEGKHAQAWKLMFETYFGRVEPVWDVETLLGVAQKLGLDEAGVREALSSRRFRDQVIAEQVEAQRLGARGVPFIVVDGRYGVSGAQPADQLVAVMQRAWNDSLAVS